MTMTSTTTDSATLEANKAVVRRFIDEIFLKGDFGAVDELLTEDFTPHTWGSIEGDRVAVRLTSSATHTGEFMGIPASGKHYEMGEIHIFRLRDGRVSEHWHQADFLGMMKQLGASPGG
jgi:predicted SnoaL-like aldol condensation-catalyzing enzyme